MKVLEANLRTKKNKPRVPRKKAISLEEYYRKGGGQARDPLDHEQLDAARKKALDANRVAAQKSRMRQRARQHHFEHQLEQTKQHATELKQHLAQLRSDLEALLALADGIRLPPFFFFQLGRSPFGQWRPFPTLS